MRIYMQQVSLKTLLLYCTCILLKCVCLKVGEVFIVHMILPNYLFHYELTTE